MTESEGAPQPGTPNPRSSARIKIKWGVTADAKPEEARTHRKERSMVFRDKRLDERSSTGQVGKAQEAVRRSESLQRLFCPSSSFGGVGGSTVETLQLPLVRPLLDLLWWLCASHHRGKWEDTDTAALRGAGWCCYASHPAHSPSCFAPLPPSTSSTDARPLLFRWYRQYKTNEL